MAVSYSTLESRSLKSQPALLNPGLSSCYLLSSILSGSWIQPPCSHWRKGCPWPLHLPCLYIWSTAPPCQLLDHLGQKPPSCLHLADLSLQQIKVSSEVEVSHDDQGLWIHRTFQLWGRPHIFPHEVAFSRQLQQLFPHWSAWFILPQVVLQQSSIAVSLLSHMKGDFPPCCPAGSSWRACTHPPQHCSPVSCPTTHTSSQLDPSPATECRPPIPPICSHTEC